MGTVKTIAGKDILRRRRMASLTIDAAAASLSRRLGRLITVNVLAGWENNFITVPRDVTLDMIAPSGPIPIPNARDPKELWEQVEPRLRPSAMAAAKAMCQMRDDGDEETPCPCEDGGERCCRAFELFGREAVASAVAIDMVQKGHLHAGVYSVDWTIDKR